MIGKLSEEQWITLTKNSFKYNQAEKKYKSNYDPRISSGETDPWYRAPVRGSNVPPPPNVVSLLSSFIDFFLSSFFLLSCY